MNQFTILLASNLNAEFHITDACECLSKAFPVNIRFSDNHWSDAVVKSGQCLPSGECGRYLNTICKGLTDFVLDDFQAYLKITETKLGRIRGVETQGSVAIDMDLVEWNGEVLRPKDAEQEYYMVCLRDL